MNIKIEENQEINIVELLQESPYCKCGMWLEFKINHILGVLQADCMTCGRKYTTSQLNFKVKMKCCESEERKYNTITVKPKFKPELIYQPYKLKE